MIIYGWGHFNRRNYSTIRCPCEFCGQYGYQQSYESSRFATLYFIPIIPFRGHKVTSECPHCKAALGLSKGKWRRHLKKDLPKAVADYEASPSGHKATANLIDTAVGCHSGNDTNPLSPRLPPKCQQAGSSTVAIARAPRLRGDRFHGHRRR